MNSAAVVVEIRRISKSYRRGSQLIPVLEEISLSIAAGEFLALMGPSGSGKSTLLNLIAGLDLAAWRAAHVGFVFQFYNLIPVLTAFENVELPLILTDLSRRRRRQQVDTVLNLVNLGDRMDHYPRQLSGGQQQRVAIARALVTDPTLIVADEPTGDLDRAAADDVLVLLERLSREMGKTVIMVTHDPRAARRAGTVKHLDKGVLAHDVEAAVPECL